MPSNVSCDDFMGFIKELDMGQLQSLRLALDSAISNKVSAVTSPIKVNVSGAHLEPSDVNDFVTHDGERFLDKVTEDLLSAELTSLNFKDKASKNCVQNIFLSSVVDGYDRESSKGAVKHGAVDMELFPTVKGIMENINSKLGTKLNSALVSYYKDGNVGTG